MYGKVFKRLYYGSLYGQTDAQSVFVFLIAHADRDGYVDMVPEAIAAPLGLTLDRVNDALVVLSQDDPRSTSTAENGRRIMPLDGRGWGWQIVNHEHYRSMRDEDDRRNQTREATKRWRARLASAGEPS